MSDPTQSELDEIVDLLLEEMAIALPSEDLSELRYRLKLLIYWERRMALIKLQEILGTTRNEVERLILPKPFAGSEDYRFGARLRRIHQRYEGEGRTW